MDSLEIAIQTIKNGKPIIMTDHFERENEGDIVIAAQFITPEWINFMAKHARGLICLSLTKTQVQKLKLKPMVDDNKSAHETAFTVSIEASKNISTGISCADRAYTILTAINENATEYDIVSPGHIFPLQAKDAGVLEREGHTEGSIDLMKIAGLNPSAVICEIMNDDGTMARLNDLKNFSKIHNIPLITIDQIIEYRKKNDLINFPNSKELIESKSVLPTVYSKTPFEIFTYGENLILKMPYTGIPHVRIHSECLTGDVFESQRCDCGSQLELSKKIIISNGGLIIYLRGHEGRGIGLSNKIKAYNLQDTGVDTVEANKILGFKEDQRSYNDAIQILKNLGILEVNLLTNNPTKIKSLESEGIKVHRIPLNVELNEYNKYYVQTKINKMKHIM